MTVDWLFPPNHDGEQHGLNDAGVETFRDNPLLSLAREIAQNSCDAADADSGKPVEVHFVLQELPMSKFPEARSFVRTLKACESYWKKSTNTTKFFKRTLELMSEKTIRVLRVSDFNTTGLRGPVTEPTSDWFKLTKSVGASDKTGVAGGSFGIGKHAPFACSELRTVLYCSKDNEGGFAFQGVSKLVTHKNTKKATTQGTGYYGNTDKNQPITKSGQVPPAFRRTQIGTDIYILGFLRNSRWEEEVAKSIIDSFFVAIHEGKLVVKVKDILINASSLPGLVTKYQADPSFAATAYYNALTSEDASLFPEEDFAGLGRIELRVVTGKELSKKIAMVRSTGMKIFDKGHIQTPVRFAGVFCAKGEKLNALLRAMEPPSHNKWEENRYEDPQYAKSIRSELYGWIADKVKSLSLTDDVEQLDAEGVSQYLPDDADDNPPPAADNQAEGEKSEPLPTILVQTRTYKPLSTNANASAETAGVEPGDDESDAPGGGEGGGGDDGGGGGGGRGGEGEGGEGGTGGTGDGKDGKGRGAGTASSTKPITLSNVRVFCTDTTVGRYRILAQPEAAADGVIILHVVGEDRRDPAPIKSAMVVGGSELQSDAKTGSVGPLRFEAGTRIAVDVVLEDALHCALGVTAHES